MTISELIGLWGERDNRYSTRKKDGRPMTLTDDEITSIRVYRLSEVGDLPKEDQRLGRVTMERWIPPTTLR